MAGAGFTGDNAKLKKLIAGVELLAKGTSRLPLNRLLAHEVLYRVQRCFEDSKSPFGKPWQSLTVRKGLPLRDTGRLMNSFSTRAAPLSFTVSTNVKYAGIHNTGGTVKHAARTELRTYRETAKGKRTRVDTYSKAKRRVRTAVSVKAYSAVMPKRQFIPEGGEKLPFHWMTALQSVADEWIRFMVLP